MYGPRVPVPIHGDDATPLHSTKLPLRVWLTGLWLILQSEKGISSVRLAEAVGVSQPTAWRMGHALRLLVTRGHPLEGTVEVDEFYIGSSPRKDADRPRLGRGRKGQPRTTKTPVLAVVQRPAAPEGGAAAGDARARVVADVSEREARRVLSEHVDVTAHLMSEEWKSFLSIGEAFAAHDTVRHSEREYARGLVHANSAEGFNDRVRRVVAGVFHHVSPRYADLYFNEVGFRWSQRVMSGQAARRTRKGREVVKPLGPASRRLSSCRRCSNQPSAASCVGPPMAASTSAAPLLSLGDKGAFGNPLQHSGEVRSLAGRLWQAATRSLPRRRMISPMW